MPTDPFMSYNFLLEIDGIITAAFQDCGGLESEIDMKEYSEGGHHGPGRKLAGKPKYSNITLKKGVASNRELYDWHKEWLLGDPTASRRSGSIILKDRSGEEVVRWNFVEAWPVKWTGPKLNAESSEVAVEQFDLAHEGLLRV